MIQSGYFARLADPIRPIPNNGKSGHSGLPIIRISRLPDWVVQSVLPIAIHRLVHRFYPLARCHTVIEVCLPEFGNQAWCAAAQGCYYKKGTLYCRQCVEDWGNDKYKPKSRSELMHYVDCACHSSMFRKRSPPPAEPAPGPPPRPPRSHADGDLARRIEELEKKVLWLLEKVTELEQIRFQHQ